MNTKEIKDDTYFAIIEPTGEKPNPNDPENRQYIQYTSDVVGNSLYFFEITRGKSQDQLEAILKKNQWLVVIEILNERKAIRKFISNK